MTIKIILYRHGQVVRRLYCLRDKWRKAYHKLASAPADRYYVKVTYGFITDYLGKQVKSTNEYDGDNLREAQQALSAFIEL